MESHFCWLLLPRETKPLIKKLSSLKSTFDVVARKKKLCLVSKNITVSNNDNIRVGVGKIYLIIFLFLMLVVKQYILVVMPSDFMGVRDKGIVHLWRIS